MDLEPEQRRKENFPPTERSLPIALIRAREKVMGPIREMLSTTGLTEQQWRVLRILNEHAWLDATTLSERAALHLPSQTRIVQTLRAKGLVTRSADAKDRRRQSVAITDKGRDLLRDYSEEASRLAAELETRLGRKKLDELLDLLSELSDT